MEGWFVLGFFMIVVGIPVLAGVAGKLGKRWLDLKEKQLELTAHEAADKAASQAVHIEKLEARMRVLERIATDKGSSLAAEIEDLRADRPVLPRAN
ncbi:hypothetical protein KCG44_05490 [Pacificimonas sp. WHA3]|uniref:Phage shock protein B n=1 Tax=Pacificimonas pallii TaxID=2827236 RepID=A0ABS6SCU4_9SPHN|nr:hypothetical protein [Pacificimonas pallii]MBV7256235.1 hypothetical protein [Pacificimonas pallii]